MSNQLLKSGGLLLEKEDLLIFRFSSTRLALSTTKYYGGFQLLRSVFYQELAADSMPMTQHDYDQKLALLRPQVGKENLPQDRCTGFQASSPVKYCGYSSRAIEKQVVEAFVIAEVNENASRAGDYYRNEKIPSQPEGGIFIFVFMNCKVEQGEMAKALLAITEAKTAVLQELAVMSPEQGLPATGTSSDGIIFVTDPESKIYCTEIGTQSLGGQAIASTVKQALKESLALGSKIIPWRQSMVEERLWRLGFENICSADLPNAMTKTQILLSFCQAVWLEYRWGLIGIDGLYQFFAFLESPLFQPNGVRLSSAFRQKIAAEIDGSEVFKSGEI